MKKRKNVVDISTKIDKENKKAKALECVEGQENKSPKNRRKVFKAVGFSSLAVLMVSASVFAFAPLGNSVPAAQNNAKAEVAETLITPKVDDPVIATLEGGLEIKWGEAAVINGGGKETGSYSYTSYSTANSNISGGTPTNNPATPTISGNLSGFPYFTTKSGSTTYNWVIIGRNSNVTNAVQASLNKTNITGSKSASKIEYKSLTDWQAKINNADGYQNFVDGYSPTYKSFFNNTYETSSPAGAAINSNGLMSSQTARNYSASTNYSYSATYKISTNTNVKTNAEIPSGCVLVLANGNVTTGAYNTSYRYSSSYTYYNASYKSTETINSAMEGYYTNGSYGLSAIKSRIQAVTVKTYTYYPAPTYSWYTDSMSRHIYPLACNNSSTFYWANYLTAAQIKLTANQWIRGNNGSQGYTGSYYFIANYINTSGSQTTAYVNNTGIGFRPAFVLKVT